MSPAAAFEDSHRTFREAMPGGFAWEAVEVYSGYVSTLHVLYYLICFVLFILHYITL